jgi:two-component system phosphate regulon response regulator PhoB
MKRVLIVEDNTDIRVLVRVTLEIEDYDVHEAANGDIGWEMAQELKPDLILLDVMMPGVLDGFAVCRRVKADPALTATKVVMLTALAQEADRSEGADAGADGYLTKPFKPGDLVDAVKDYIGN